MHFVTFISAAYLFCNNCILIRMRTNGCVHFVDAVRALVINNQGSKMKSRLTPGRKKDRGGEGKHLQ